MNLVQDDTASWQWLVQKLCLSGEKWQSLKIYQNLTCFFLLSGSRHHCVILLFCMWTFHHSVVHPEVVNISVWTGWQNIYFSLGITCNHLKLGFFSPRYKILAFIRKDNIQVFVFRISSNCIVGEDFSSCEHLLDLEDNKHWSSYEAYNHQNRLGLCPEDQIHLAHGLSFLLLISNERFCNFSA